ncbi:MAG: 30S ribosomal protein S18 [Chloroflexi bacterium]|nr:30S ribosomal protein S18 [Chloroflexota bacterium]
MPQQARPRREGTRKKFIPKKRFCSFCADKVVYIDYKDTARLQRFISERARIDPRRRTGVCAKHQRSLSQALKRARHIALLPFTPEHVRLSGGAGLRREQAGASSPQAGPTTL